MNIIFLKTQGFEKQSLTRRLNTVALLSQRRKTLLPQLVRLSPFTHRVGILTYALLPRALAAATCRWWAQVDSNHRPRAYQARALTT